MTFLQVVTIDQKKVEMTFEKYTISDIANELGVSRATVSRAINGKDGVSEDVRTRILNYTQSIGYKPNTIAQSLSKGHLNIIALVLGDLRNPFYAELAFRMQKMLNEHGYMVMVFNSEYDVEKELEFIKMSQMFCFAGLMLITVQQRFDAHCLSSSTPVVLVNRSAESYNGDAVFIDNFQASYMCMVHLLSLGHRRIGFIHGQETSSASNLRYVGYVQAMENYQMPIDERHVFHGDLKMESGREAAELITQMEPEQRPTAMLVANDLTALGFMDGCWKHGIKVPEDVSLVSFDNISFSSMCNIQLTTIDQNLEEMCSQAVRLILKRLNNPEAPYERVIIQPTLIVRNTTSAPKN